MVREILPHAHQEREASHQEARQLVFGFKDGNAESIEIVAQKAANQMLAQFGARCPDIVPTCVPASSATKNETRYKVFCQRVCQLSGCINGFDHVRVLGERLTIHENRRKEKDIRKASTIDFDTDWFNGKQVLCFDDIITRGHSYATFANQLESFSANVLGGYFLARTHYNVNKP